MTPLSPMQKRFLHNGLVRQLIITLDGQYQTPDALLVLDMKVCDECGEVNHIANYLCIGCGARIVIIPEDERDGFRTTKEKPPRLRWIVSEKEILKRAEQLRKQNGLPNIKHTPKNKKP